MMYNNASTPDTSSSNGGAASINCYNEWGVGIATINGISFAINTFHLIIISRMPSLKGRPYKYILIHITLADMCSAALLIWVYSCLEAFVRVVKLTSKFPIVLNMVSWPIDTSHWIFLVAGIEQYYSICKPLVYESSRFVDKLPLIMILTWVISFCWTIVYVVVGMVVDPSTAVVPSWWRHIYTTVNYLPLILAAIPLTMVIKELTKMRKKTLAANQRQSLRASVYLIIIYMIFTVFGLFSFVTTYIHIVNHTLLKFPAQRLRNISKAFYGILNTVIYGFRTKAYRQEIRKLLGKEN